MPAHVRAAAAKARAAAALRAAHEAAVGGGGGARPADAALLAAFLAYVKLEQAQGDPARVQARQRGLPGDGRALQGAAGARTHIHRTHTRNTHTQKHKCETHNTKHTSQNTQHARAGRV